MTFDDFKKPSVYLPLLYLFLFLLLIFFLAHAIRNRGKTPPVERPKLNRKKAVFEGAVVLASMSLATWLWGTDIANCLGLAILTASAVLTRAGKYEPEFLQNFPTTTRHALASGFLIGELLALPLAIKWAATPFPFAIDWANSQDRIWAAGKFASAELAGGVVGSFAAKLLLRQKIGAISRGEGPDA